VRGSHRRESLPEALSRKTSAWLSRPEGGRGGHRGLQPGVSIAPEGARSLGKNAVDPRQACGNRKREAFRTSQRSLAWEDADGLNG